MNKKIHLLIGLFLLSLSSCNDDNTYFPSINSDSTALHTTRVANYSQQNVQHIIEYAKLNFDENFENTKLYNKLVMSPKWDEASVAYQSHDTLYVSIPIDIKNSIDDKSYYLFASSTDPNVVRFTIIGIPQYYWESITNPISTFSSDVDGGWLPEIDVLGDLCIQMSHICSDPYDEIFLDYLHEKWIWEQIQNGGSSYPNGSPLGDGYPWDNLNDQEKKFIRQHPIAAKKFYDNALKAGDAARPYPGQHNGEGDAIRHTYWSALNTFSESEELAKQFGNAHEQTPGQPASEKAMDLFNNAVGYALGNLAKQNNWSSDRLFQEVINYKNNGKLQTHL